MLWILKPDASVPIAVASAAAMTATNCPCERAVSGSAESCLMLWMRRPRASVPMYVASAAATTASKQARSPIGNPVCLETAGAGAFAACCFEAGCLCAHKCAHEFCKQNNCKQPYKHSTHTQEQYKPRAHFHIQASILRMIYSFSANLTFFYKRSFESLYRSIHRLFFYILRISCFSC